MADQNSSMDAGERYARALFDLAGEIREIEAIEADLVALKSMQTESAELRQLLASPIFKADQKAAVLAALADRAGFQPTTRKCLGLMARNQRANVLPSMIAAFQRMSAKARGVVAAQVTTALPLTAAQSESLAAALRTALGKDPAIEMRVDPAILGGVKVRVGSRLFDASLKSKLDSLKFALKRA